jgi:spermidine synthase
MIMRNIPVILIGTNAILLQIVCLRQLLSTFSGNELLIGITLAAWLILVSFGSYIGTKIELEHAFGISFIDVAILSQPTVILVEMVRPILQYSLGETIPLPATIAWTVVSLSLLCITIGLQFPLAVTYLKENASEVYSFEALGAFVGGAVFTFLLAGHLDSYQIAFVSSFISICTAVYLLRKAVLLPLLLLPLLIYIGGGKIIEAYQYEGFELVSRTESRYGEITVLKMEQQQSLYSSEKYQFSYPDPQTEELKAHLPMSLQPDAKDILVIGGSPAVMREFLKYSISNIDLVEIDPLLVKTSIGMLNPDDREGLNDKRISIFHRDARMHVRALEPAGYDMILLNIPEPATANLNRFYTVEFFEEARNALRDDGILYLGLPASFGYISKRMQMANGSVYSSLKKVFPNVEVSSEEYGVMIASMSPVNVDPEVLVKRFSESGIETEHFKEYILADAFRPLQMDMVKSRLGKVHEINSDRRPVSYLYNMMLWAEVHKGRWLNLLLGRGENQIMLFAGVILILLTLLFLANRQPVSYAVFTTGYFTMAFSIVVMLTYQSFFGYVYEMIGMLEGTFMIGAACGAYVMRRMERPERWLSLFDLSALALLLLSLFILNNAAAFYLMILAAGFIGGGQFASATRSYFKEAAEGIGGRLYAVDLAGSFFGALLTAIFLVPLIGMQKTILFLVLMKMVSLIYLLSYKKT